MRKAMGILTGTLALALASTACAQAPEPTQGERTVYELRVTGYGSRSQGVRGVLFDEGGQEIAEDGAGQSVDTPVGRFRYIACQHLWSVCGYFRDAATVAAYPGPPIDPDKHEVMVWRLTVSSTPAPNRWHAYLFDDRMAAVDQPVGNAALETPVGLFRTRSARLGILDGSGPLPEGWTDGDTAQP